MARGLRPRTIFAKRLGRGQVGSLGFAGDRGKGAGFAQPGQAGVRADADEDVVGRMHGADGDAERRVQGQVVDENIHPGDFDRGRFGPGLVQCRIGVHEVS